MFTSLITVAVLHWLALLSPGPNVLLVTHMAAHGQRKAALYAAAGITIAGCMWAGIAISGVSAIFSAHNTARLLFQTIGGLYLAYIGWRIASKSSAKDLERSVALSAAGAFRLGLTTNALNPKAALFFASIFTAALPANADAGFVAACVIVVFVNALAWHVLLALAFSHPAVQRAYALHQSLLCKVAGTLVALFGIRLIVLAALEWLAR
jgi:threonine efflux protein